MIQKVYTLKGIYLVWGYFPGKVIEMSKPTRNYSILFPTSGIRQDPNHLSLSEAMKIFVGELKDVDHIFIPRDTITPDYESDLWFTYDVY